MATPAEVANDMAAQARYWHRRDDDFERVCLDTARVIRKLLEGHHVDGRTLYGLDARLTSCASRADRRGQKRFGLSLLRARGTLNGLAGRGLKS